FVAMTQVIMGYSLVLAVDMYATVFKKDPLGAALECLQEQDSPVGDAMEQDFLGWPPNPDMLVKEMFGQAPAANLLYRPPQEISTILDGMCSQYSTTITFA
ncbi:hypothetical protein M405DRAFT_820404, partial [Rhizopogon salebrosus TDB-379]